MQKVTPSFYVFAREQNLINVRNVRWWVAPKLFFVHGELGTPKFPSTNSQTKSNNFEVQGIFGGQVCKCDVG